MHNLVQRYEKKFFLHSPLTFFIFFRLYFRYVELVALLEHFLDGIDFQELSGTAQTDIATEVGYLVVELDITLLTQHAHGSQEELFAGDMVFLIDGNHTVGEI